jgi:hypothetical protein
MPVPVAPDIEIKIQPPSSCADTGSDSILLRQTGAVAATLDIYPTTHPLHVRFPDGQTAQSIGITTVALPSTDIPLPAHITPFINLYLAYPTLLTWIMMQRFKKKDNTYTMAMTLFITRPSPSTKHLGLHLYIALLLTLMPFFLCLPTRNSCISFMLQWAVRLPQQSSAHYVKVTCLHYHDSLPLCSASTDPTLKLPQWAISMKAARS